QDAWHVDVCLTGSQKAIGVPVGLGLIMVSDEAMARFEERKMPVANYYCDINNWLPIMRAYHEDKAAYFATPPVNSIYALDVSLQQILAEGMEPRFERHLKLASAFQAGMRSLGIELVAKPGVEAPTVSGMYYPAGVDSGLVGKVGANGVTIAGGVLPAIASKYFRVGHMGTCTASDIVATIGAIERALLDSGAKVSLGAGVGAAQHVLSD
ncbi:MAG TPA: alanine--glyoxylate aminotransferase family protein, partial [Chloroflexota bacterium]|nr:alanine--glyoxylate aminotransferase family protein [Chloroflexota bacterium]